MNADATPSSVLILHGGRFGQSEAIAKEMGEVLANAGVPVSVEELTRASVPSEATHRAFVVVTSVRYGHFDKNAERFIAKHRAWLDSVPTLLVTVSLTARSPEKRSPETHSYTTKFLEKTGWAPTIVEVMAGALRYPQYHWLDKKMIQLIMKITGGVTDTTADIEYTDWDQVRDCATRFGAEVLTDNH